MSLRIFLITILATTGLAGYSQYEEVKASNNPLDQNKSIVKVELSNVVNPYDPSALLSLEYLFGQRWSITQEIGIVTGLRGEQEYDRARGFKLREELRHYFDGSLQENTLMYVGFNLSYRYLQVDDGFILGYGCFDGQPETCDYQKLGTGSLIYHRFAGFIRLGIAKQLSPRLTLESDVGLGYKYLTEKLSGPDDAALLFHDSVNSDLEQLGTSIYPTFSAKVGYVLSSRD